MMTYIRNVEKLNRLLKRNRSTLVYYEKENKKYGKQGSIKLRGDQIIFIFEELRNEFAPNSRAKFRFNNRLQGGQYTLETRTIETGNATDLGTLAHEFAHYLYHKKHPNLNPNNRISWHNPEHAKLMEKIMRYCASKNNWKEELENNFEKCPCCDKRVYRRKYANNE